MKKNHRSSKEYDDLVNSKSDFDDEDLSSEETKEDWQNDYSNVSSELRAALEKSDEEDKKKELEKQKVKEESIALTSLPETSNEEDKSEKELITPTNQPKTSNENESEKKLVAIFQEKYKREKELITPTTQPKTSNENEREKYKSERKKEWVNFLETNKNFPNFETSIRLQKGKMQNQKKKIVTISDTVKYIQSEPENSFSIEPYSVNLICIDIDSSLTGQKILTFFKAGSPSISFHDVFNNPLMIQTKTPNHLHLYYKLPEILKLNKKKPFKILWPTRLGFPAEYITSTVTIGDSSRTILNGFNLIFPS